MRGRAVFGEGFDGGRVDVVGDAGVAGLHEAADHVGAHAAEADHSELHCVLLLGLRFRVRCFFFESLVTTESQSSQRRTEAGNLRVFFSSLCVLCDLRDSVVSEHSMMTGRSCSKHHRAAAAVLLWDCFARLLVFGDLLFGGFDDAVGAEAEFFDHVFQWRGGTEGVHADDFAGESDVAGPAHGGGLFDGDAGFAGGGENFVAIGLVLPLEEFPGGHADDAGFDAFFFQGFVGVGAEGDFAACADEDDIGLSIGGVAGEDVGALGETGGGGVGGAVEGGHGLAREDEADGVMFHGHEDARRLR